MRLITEPRPFFIDDAAIDSDVDERADVGDSFVEEDIEFRVLKWRGAFIFNDFDSDARADVGRIVRALDARDASDVHPDRSIEF